MAKPRVLLAEFRYESNKFCSNKTGREEYEARYLKLGDEIIPFFKGVKVEIGALLMDVKKKASRWFR